MAKKKRPASSAKKPPAQASSDRTGAATLKDRLQPEVLNKLKAQANELKEAESQRREAERRQAEEARQAEQKRLEQDFGHLLANSSLDWRKYK